MKGKYEIAAKHNLGGVGPYTYSDVSFDGGLYTGAKSDGIEMYQAFDVFLNKSFLSLESEDKEPATSAHHSVQHSVYHSLTGLKDEEVEEILM